MTLVVGATGLLGQEICRLLAERGRPFTALVRPTSDPAKIQHLRLQGARIAEGDLKDRASLDAACRGLSTVISTASATVSRQPGDAIETVDRDGQLNLVDAARGAGVRHFVFVSFIQMPVGCPLEDAKRGVERSLIDSGMVYTILRPTHFMEIWLGPALGLDVKNATAQIFGAGDRKLSWISFRDVAQFALAALESPPARNAVIDLGGPDALSQLDVVRMFEEETGRRFSVQHVSEDALRSQLGSAHDSLGSTFAALMLAAAQGRAIDMTATLSAIPVSLSSVRDHVRRLSRP